MRPCQETRSAKPAVAAVRALWGNVVCRLQHLGARELRAFCLYTLYKDEPPFIPL